MFMPQCGTNRAWDGKSSCPTQGHPTSSLTPYPEPRIRFYATDPYISFQSHQLRPSAQRSLLLLPKTLPASPALPPASITEHPNPPEHQKLSFPFPRLLHTRVHTHPCAHTRLHIFPASPAQPRPREAVFRMHGLGGPGLSSQ